MKRNRIIHWVATGLLSAMMLGSGGGYLFKTQEVIEVFATLGFPSFVVIPLGIAKIVGVLVILTKKWKWLTEWAYAGFNFNFFLAFFSHMSIGDNEWLGSVIALVLLYISYSFWKIGWQE